MSFTLQDISDNIVPVHDFPKQGIMFRDVTNLLLNNELFNFTIDKMAEIVNLSGLKPDYIAGLESRGFLFRELANRLKCGFVMIRKPNKLPNSISIDYEKEYGTDSLTITNSISEGSKILLVDDLMATGGTMNAGRKLIELIKCTPIGCINLIELVGLPVNKELLESKIPVLSLLKYNFDDPSVILNKTLNCVLTIKDYIPLITNNESNQTIVFCHPSIETLSDNYIANHPGSRKGTIIWDKFPDTQPNISFENMDQLENNKIVFFLSLYDTGLLFQQLSMLMVLPRQFIDTLDIYIAYFSVGTMERVDKEGMLATAETMAKIISSCIETTKNGKATIHIWDIHALPIRFYFNTNNVLIKLHSGIPSLTNIISDNSIIVFPDDGACKRFKQFFPHYKTIVCSKVREGNDRIIKITDKLNFPVDLNDAVYDEVIIVDDLVQSGGTIIKCKKALEALGYTNISAYVTHSVFPNDGWKKMIKANFKNFYTTNTVPETTDKLIDIPCFKILNIFGEQSKPESLIIYVASHNEQKMKAVYDSFNEFHKDKQIIVKGVNASSDICEQPIGDETTQGCENRLTNLDAYLTCNNLYYDYVVSIENGLINKLNGTHQDVCVIKIFKKRDTNGNGYHVETFYDLNGSSKVIVPNELVDICIKNNQGITIGDVIQLKTGIPKDNWHQYFNEEKKTRIDIMSDLLKNRIKYLINPINSAK
jgi:adenine phosphoribosyltransferase